MDAPAILSDHARCSVMKMKCNFYILRKYWMAHKGKAFTLLFSIILMTAMLSAVLLLERSDVRRELHRHYDLDGCYDNEFLNVQEDQISAFTENDLVEEWGLSYLFGKVGTGTVYYNLGGFDAEAAKLAHYPLTEGRMPENTGEIALTEQLRNALCLGAAVGDRVTIPIYDQGCEWLGEKEYTLVGVIDGENRNSFLDAETNIYSEPQAVVSYEEAKQYSNGSYNVLLTLKGDGLFSLLPADDPRTEIYAAYYASLPACSMAPTSRQSAIQAMSGSMYQLETGENVPTSTKTKMLQIVSSFAAVVAMISLFSGITVVMQKRKDSFLVLRRIGFSARRLQGMLCMEGIVFLLIGLVCGLLLGVLFYEIVFGIQVHLLGMPDYRGYFVEWIVKKKTVDPWTIPALAAAVTTVAAYMIPILQLKRSLSASGNKMKKHRKAARYLSQAMSRILSQRSVECLQTVSLVCVMIAAMIGYLYCTFQQKDMQELHQIGAIYNSDMVEESYVVNGVFDLKELGLDRELSSHAGKEFSYMARAQTAGLSDASLREMAENGAEEIYGYSSPFHLLFYTNGEEDPLNKMALDATYAERFETEETIAAVPCVLLSDALMQQLAEAVGETLPEGIIYISASEESPVGTRTMLCAKTDELGLYPAETEEKEVEFAGHIQVRSEALGGYPILQYALSSAEQTAEQGSPTARGKIAVMSGSYAASMGFYQQTYDEVLLSMGETTTEEALTAMLAATLPAESMMHITSRFMIHEKYIKASINAYTTIAFLFVLLLCIHIVGYCNVWKLKLQTRSDRIAILRSMGLSRRKLQMHLSLQTLKIPVISTAVAAVFVVVFQKFMAHQYDTYQAMYDLAYADGWSPELFGKADQFAQTFLLDAGLWMPSWELPLTLLAVVVCGFSIVSVLILLRQQTSGEIITAIKKEEWS